MTVLLQRGVTRTLATLEARLVAAPPGEALVAWVFEAAVERRAAESRLARLGIDVSVRSAYKPLLHAFLEDIDLADVVAIDVCCPVVPGVPEGRFRLECYPLDALVGDRELTFGMRHADVELPTEPLDPRGPGAAEPTVPPLGYEVSLGYADGGRRTIDVPAPNRWVTDDRGAPVLRNCGWFGAPNLTDLEEAFDATRQAIAEHPWPLAAGGPFFECLSIALSGPFRDEPLPVGSECVSLAEAMHEELYFSTLELFSERLALPDGTRAPRPGQIVPIVRSTADDRWRLRVALEPAPAVEDDVAEDAASADELARAGHWPSPAQIEAQLDALGGEACGSVSYRGRRVGARHVRARHVGARDVGPRHVGPRHGAGGAAPSVVLSAGQHANETSGPVGVLRAAAELRASGTVDFVVTPLLNPDGYALFRACCADHPGHLHHAARYTALGNDLEHGDEALERGALIDARARTRATLHVNCHGYPSHEWTRPLSGYIPRGFPLWTLPKGFFLILRHAPGYRDAGERIVDACVRALAAFEPIMAINEEQLRRYARYASPEGFEIRSGVPVYIGRTADELFPLTLITEAPDETVYGERFRVLHEAQRRVVLAAVAAHAAAGRA